MADFVTGGRYFALAIARTNSRRVSSRFGRKTSFQTGPSGKGGSRFFERGNYRFVWSHDRDRSKKRIETSATFHGYERHAENPIGTSNFSLFLYLALSVTVLLSVLPFLFNISTAQGPPRTILIAWRNIQYTPRISNTRKKEMKSYRKGIRISCDFCQFFRQSSIDVFPR